MLVKGATVLYSVLSYDSSYLDPFHGFWCLAPCSTKPSTRIGITHYSDILMGMMASQITSLPIVYSNVYSGTDQRKHQSSVSLAFVWGIHWWQVNSPYKWPVTQKMFPFDDVIMRMVGNICHCKKWVKAGTSSMMLTLKLGLFSAWAIHVFQSKELVKC